MLGSTRPKVECINHKGVLVARKTLPRTIHAFREVHITKHLQGCKGVVGLFDVEEDDTNVNMYLEKCDSIKYWKRDPRPLIHEMLGILDGVHKRGIVHGDVKPDNLMQAEDGSLRLIDFGSSVYMDDDKAVLTHTTPMFCSPEAMRSNMTDKSDVWSVGVMAFWLMSGDYPFQGETVNSIFRQVLNRSIDVDGIYDDRAAHFVLTLMQRDVAKRPTAAEAMKHEWFQ